MPSVLVVEDSELLRRIYTDRLQADGYTVSTASDGVEALSILRSQQVDAVLLDLIMPVMSGVEVLEQMHNDPILSAIPVLVLSNLGQESDIERALQLGAADYLIKNDSRPNVVSERLGQLLSEARTTAPERLEVLRIHIRDREGDADRLVEREGLTQRFWCPACQVEMTLMLTPLPERPHHYDAHLVCAQCGREF